MKITNKHYGNLTLSTDLEMAGLLSGDLIVSYGCTALVSGIVAGRIYVESGGRLLLNGSALSGVTNRGGRVEIYGVVNGGLEEVSGETVISSRAVIR
ncbi:hypothetical protein [Erwinia sp. SLM-02]|uniref:hypothetical protein n=1 Tax=Erwinia sp. SLM-02 TaxID=3020057 RepID=UPI0028D77D3E|nr:hypothetical protein [uncultured Erwinia sp.]